MAGSLQNRYNVVRISHAKAGHLFSGANNEKRLLIQETRLAEVQGGQDPADLSPKEHFLNIPGTS